MPNKSVKNGFSFYFPCVVLTICFFRVSQKVLDSRPRAYFLRIALQENAPLLDITAELITIYPIVSGTKGICVTCKHHSLFWINQPKDKHSLDCQRPSLDVLTPTTIRSEKCHQTRSSHHVGPSYQ